MNDTQQSMISRRDWIRQSSLAALMGTTLVSSVSSADEPRTPHISFGFSLYGMKSLPLSQAVRTLAKIGYDAVEIVCTAGWDTEPEKFSMKDRREARKLLNGEGMQLPGLMENLHLLVETKVRSEHLERIKRAGELGHELSPDAPPVLETVLGGKSAEWPSVKDQIVEELGHWAEAAESVKTVVAIKPHVGGSVWNPEAADWLVRRVNSPRIRLVYDFSHYQVHNFDLEQSLTLLLPNSVFIHVKDNVGTDGKVQFALPGDGQTDYEQYFKTVKSSKYSGTVMVEVSSQLWNKPEYDPELAARKSFANLQDSLSKSGLWNGRVH